MAKPSTIIRDTILAQQLLLQQIDGGADWHSAAGALVSLRPLHESEPPLNIAMTEWRIEVGDEPNATLLVTWTAAVPIDADDAIADSLVLADMLSALAGGDCATSPRISDIGNEPRESGSNYAAVSVTTRTHLIL